jgi:hypothetical protein
MIAGQPQEAMAAGAESSREALSQIIAADPEAQQQLGQIAMVLEMRQPLDDVQVRHLQTHLAAAGHHVSEDDIVRLAERVEFSG